MLEPLPDEYFMREALRQAQKAYAADEVPVGAVVVREDKIIGRAHNQVELLKDATAHAEMLALTQAEAAVGDWRLTDCDLYVTKEPCAMCAGAVVHTRIRRVIFGCADPSAGAAGSMMNLLQMPSFNHRCEITSGVLQKECAAILQDFFRKPLAAFFGAFTLMRILAFTGFCRFTARPISCEASINSREKMGWKMRERSGGSRDMSRSALS